MLKNLEFRFPHDCVQCSGSNWLRLFVQFCFYFAVIVLLEILTSLLLNHLSSP